MLQALMYTYLGGVGLKLIYNLVDKEKRHTAVDNFNETVLWPLYLIWDYVGFFINFFTNDD